MQDRGSQAGKRTPPFGGITGSQRVPNVPTNAHWEKGGSSRSKEGETRKNEAFYDKARENRLIRKTNHRFKVIALPEEASSWNERVILRFYPNQQHLRIRNTVVEHPYGTVKRWHGAGYLLTKGKLKVAAETGLSFLAYNFRRVINILGVNGTLEMIIA